MYNTDFCSALKSLHYGTDLLLALSVREEYCKIETYYKLWFYEFCLVNGSRYHEVFSKLNYTPLFNGANVFCFLSSLPLLPHSHHGIVWSYLSSLYP
jgi:hypothetical protein